MVLNFPVKNCSLCHKVFTSVPSDNGPEDHLVTNRVTEFSSDGNLLLTIVHFLCNYMCLARCALNQPHKWCWQNLIPENSTNFTEGKFLFWLPSYLKSHVIWRKLSKITHHPGTEITRQSFQNFTPETARSLSIAIGISFDHLNLSPYLITCASPSLLAAASVASCLRFFPTSVAASPS